MKGKKLNIDEFDIMAELEKIRPNGHHKTLHFTDEMDMVLLAARDCPANHQVRWRDLCEIWAKKWQPVSQDTLRARLRELQAKRKEA
jgi:hypothetical protein